MRYRAIKMMAREARRQDRIKSGPKPKSGSARPAPRYTPPPAKPASYAPRPAQPAPQHRNCQTEEIEDAEIVNKTFKIILIGTAVIAVTVSDRPGIEASIFACIFGIIILLELLLWLAVHHCLPRTPDAGAAKESAEPSWMPPYPTPPDPALEKAKALWRREQATISAEELRQQAQHAQMLRKQKQRDREREEEERLNHEARWRQAVKHGQETPEDKDRAALKKWQEQQKEAEREKRRQAAIDDVERQVIQNWHT